MHLFTNQADHKWDCIIVSIMTPCCLSSTFFVWWTFKFLTIKIYQTANLDHFGLVYTMTRSWTSYIGVYLERASSSSLIQFIWSYSQLIIQSASNAISIWYLHCITYMQPHTYAYGCKSNFGNYHNLYNCPKKRKTKRKALFKVAKNYNRDVYD